MAAGWREWVTLPDLSPIPIKAKLDTGARTSALHAFRLKRFERDGKPWVRFDLHPRQRSRNDATSVEALVVDERMVKSSNGRQERRPVIRTRCQIGGRIWRIEITLTRRDDMSFRLLLGRTALKGRLIVDSGRSYLLGGESLG